MADSGRGSAVRALPATAPAEAYDRVPPHNLDAEVSVLGSMLLSRDAIAEISELVGPGDFYRGAHRTVFEAVTHLYDRGEPVDAVTLADELEGRGQLDSVGGGVAIADLLAKVPTSANAVYYARIVAEHALRRRLIDAGTHIARLGYQPDTEADEAVDSAEALIYQVAQRGHSGEFTPMKDLLAASFELIERLHESDSAVTGLATGFADLDHLTAGLQPANLVIVAARPAMGKCLGGSTPIVDPRSGARRRLDDMVTAGANGAGLEVVSLDGDLRLRAVAVGQVHDNGRRPVFRVRTRLGREVVATANHPFLTVAGWLPLHALDVGDHIATPRALPIFGTDALPDAEVALLALLIGDGGLSNPSPVYTTTSPVLLNDLRRWAAAVGVEVSSVGDGRGGYRLATRRGAPNPLTDRLRVHGLMGSRSREMFVPDAIFRLPRGQMALFLNRLFATDGCVYASPGFAQVTYASVSERLIGDVQHLLLRFGVIAKRRQLRRRVSDGTDVRAWELQITDADSIRTFCTEIGILGQQERLGAASAFSARRRRHNSDLVPRHGWADIVAAKSSRLWANVSDATGPSRSHDRHGYQRSPSRAVLSELAVAADRRRLSDPVASDVSWDEIVALEAVGEERVYDLTVPALHNFVAADVIAHNSTMVTNMATHVAVELREPVVLFSLEMSQMELVQRILAAEGRVDSERLRTGRLQENDWPKLSQAIGRLAEAPLFIDDTPGINMMEIRSKCRRLKQKHGLALVIVDYLQLMQSHRRAENRVTEVAEISRGLKILAKELDVPVIALSQLSRKPEDRTDRRPQLADLRESGCVTGDTRVVLASGETAPIASLCGQQPQVMTLDAWQVGSGTATKVWQTGTRPVFQLRLASGRQLRATGNHRFRTLLDWRALGDLAPGDRIAAPRCHAQVGRISATTNTDTIPCEVWDLVRRRMRERGISQGRMAQLRGSAYGGTAQPAYAPSSTTLESYAGVLDDPELKAIAAADVYWDTVTEIEPCGVEDVYDMTVPGSHNFIAEGVVAHNSIEQDADIVCFIYRDEVYNEDSDAKGEAELIVAKHRNGPLRTIRLSFMGHYTRFASMARGPMRGGPPPGPPGVPSSGGPL